ncbi:hypothetical protein OTU49_017364 [Cherax quadricarinatus]|uniref:LIM zinc-binding domain-containing protein n=1 Tax=Cherax quadricarinatus TaxID=27406 RepID=A0AAW0XP17_CHEQU
MPGNLRYGGQNSARPVPKRAMSLDSLHDKNASLDLKVHEYIPSRITRTSPKINESAMQFVKTGPAVLYKSATEQIKKAEAVKAMRQHLIDEEADWQAQPSSSSSSKNPYDEGSDWQSNLDKWKSSRRKRNEEALIRAIEIKKHEQEEELIRMRRKSKTFSEIQEDKSKRGRRYNLVVHNDDSSDLSGLGLSSAKSTSSLSDAHEENDVKDLDQDNKDAKSDAGFCTGSDTGSDGVFAEDNISDTSSALGDKKEAHDSLLDTGVSKEEDAHLNGHGSSLITDVFHSTAATIHTDEYTYDKAIAGYKQYAENSAKKRTSSITSLNSNTSYTKDDDRKDEKICVNGRSPSPNKSNKVEEKLNFFSKEMEKDFRSSPEPRVIMREKSPRVDVGKRRSMFETRDPSPHSEKEQRIANRRSLDVSNSLRHKVKSFENLEIETPRVRGITPTRDTNLRNKVASFENLDAECTKVRTITPTRDAKFYEKRASFAAKDYETQPIRKKTPERDVNFHRKLASFTSIENREEDKVREIKTIPQRDPTLRTKIASFEQLEQSVDPRSSSPREEMLRSRDRSVSLEHLNEPQAKEVKIRPARSLMNITRRMPSTPYMVVDLEGSGVEEKCVMETKPMVNAQVFELASKLEETPLLGSPIHKAPTDLPPVSLTHEDDSFEGAKPYTDDDINEVDDESHSESQDTVDEHHYQTLEEVREEVKVNAEQVKVPPSVPASSISPPVLDTPEVLDVTWTDGPSQAAPPSEPPPPPPPDDDSDIDASDEPQSLPTEEEDAFTRESSTRRLKKELWRRRSDFLGTSSQYIEEETVKPPPDLSDLLRQERDSERCLLESQVSRNSIQEILSEAEIVRREREIIESLERSEQQKQQQHEQYIWDDGLQENITNETKTENDEHMQYQECLNTDRNSCSQELPSVPPPPPSPVSNITLPFAYLAANLPTPSDFIPMSPLPEGDEISNCNLQCNDGTRCTGVCSSPPPLPLAPVECSVPILTPIPECEENNPSSPQYSMSEPSTTPEITAPYPSSPQVTVQELSETPEFIAKSVSHLSTPELSQPSTPTDLCTTRTQKNIESYSQEDEPLFLSHIKDGSETSSLIQTQSPVPSTNVDSSLNMSDPLCLQSSTKIQSTFNLSENHNSESVLHSFKETPPFYTQVSVSNSTSNLHLNSCACQSSDSVDVTSPTCVGKGTRLHVEPSTEVPGLPVQTGTDILLPPTQLQGDEWMAPVQQSVCCVEASLTPSNHNLKNSSPKSSVQTSSLESATLSKQGDMNINSSGLCGTLACSSGSQHIYNEQVISGIKEPSKKSIHEKTVRFNIDETLNNTHSFTEHTTNLCDSDTNVLNFQLEEDMSITVSHEIQTSAQNHLQPSCSFTTASILSPPQAKNLQTSFELDKESRVPMRVPVTSTNVLESSHSVSKTTDAEHWQMNYDSLGSSSTVLKSTLNTEKTHAELLESHIAKSETIAEAPPHSSMRSESQTSAETEGLLPSESREQYEGHLVAHSSTLDYSDDSLVSTSSHPEEYKKLAELEEEMMRHDKDMLRRTGQLTNGSTAGSDSQPSVNSSLSSYATHGEHSPFPLHHFPQSTENSNYNFQQQSSSHLPIQEFYTAPTYESAASASMVQGEGVGTFRPPLQKSVPLPAGSPSQYSTLASPHPFSRSNSQSSLESSKHPPVQAMRSVPLASPRESIPEPLPRKKKAPPPTPSKSLKLTSELNNAERLEAIRVSRMPTTVSVVTENDQIESQGPSVSPSGQQMSKQTLLALSAIPKPRLTDNESWITKKKPDAQKRDYSKHWLHQEAEQRRLEQQDRISRQKLPVAQPQPKSSQNVSPQQTSHNSTLPQITSYPPTQNTSNYTPQNSSSTYSNYPQSLRNPSPSQSCNNNTTTSSWRNQATTYQPHIPSPAPNGDKALPDSIIHNLTQRVNNKNSKNTYTNASGRLGNNYGSNSYRDENYHDYMNADALSVSHTHAPLYQSGMGPGQPSPPTSQQEANSAKDQRLLSVSGKKKCSHCSEELGRGAAMIIESLRLFYHIPCFKCCVCGIQLGNGSAGADVRVRNHKLHCHNCYSNDEGMKFSKV